jgi:hypothetical protein
MEMTRKGLVEEEASTWQGKYPFSERKIENLWKKVSCYFGCDLDSPKNRCTQFAEPEEAVLSYDEVTQEESKGYCM